MDRVTTNKNVGGVGGGGEKVSLFVVGLLSVVVFVVFFQKLTQPILK